MKNKLINNTFNDKYHDTLNNIYNDIIKIIPEEYINAKAYHEWIYNLDDNFNNNIDIIRNSEELKNHLTDGGKYKFKNIKNMDEIYYSVPPKNNEKMYGDTGLYAEHIDGISPFDDCIIYRILISLTPKQKIYTIFTKQNTVVELDKYEYIGFDFNKEPHKVSGNLTEGNHRILLKLHYIVYKNKSKKEIKDINDYFVNFEHFTRTTMSYGSKPKNYFEYFVGQLGNYGTMIRLKSNNILLSIILGYTCFLYGKKINNITFFI